MRAHGAGLDAVLCGRSRAVVLVVDAITCHVQHLVRKKILRIAPMPPLAMEGEGGEQEVGAG